MDEIDRRHPVKATQQQQERCVTCGRLTIRLAVRKALPEAQDRSLRFNGAAVRKIDNVFSN
jgi:hypothetical protein